MAIKSVTDSAKSAWTPKDPKPLETPVLVRNILQFCHLKQDLPNAVRTCRLFHKMSKHAAQDQIKAEMVRTKTLVLDPKKTNEHIKVCRFSSNHEFFDLCAKIAPSVITIHLHPQVHCSGLDAIRHHFSHVENLHIKSYEFLDMYDVDSVLKSLPNLKHIDFSYSRVQGMLVMGIRNAISCCKSLTSVDFSQCCLTDADLKFFATSCPYLKSLNLSFCHDITDESLITIAQYCPELEDLTLQGLERITDKSIDALNSSNRKLTNLNVSGCVKLTEGPICALIKLSGRKLQSIDVCGISDELEPVLSALKEHCPNLTSLYVNGQSVTDDLIISILEACKNLSQINLYSCRSLTQKAFHALALYPKSITHLSLNGSEISDKELSLLSEKHPHLEKINLLRCKKVTSEGIIALAQHCRNLRSIEANHDHFSYNAMVALAKYCPQLTSLQNGDPTALDKCNALRNLTFLLKPDTVKKTLPL